MNHLFFARLKVDSFNDGTICPVFNPLAVAGMLKSQFYFSDEHGTAAIEFAVLAPVLVAMLLGIVSYGGYFWLSHSVQQSANDGARAAIAGLNRAERATLARASVFEGLPAYSILDPKAVQVTVAEDATRMTVTVHYDASATPFFLFKGVLPMPSSTIASNAVVRLGGY